MSRSAAAVCGRGDSLFGVGELMYESIAGGLRVVKH